MSTLNIDQGIHKVKLKVARSKKRKKTTWVSFCVFLEQKVERKALFSEE